MSDVVVKRKLVVDLVIALAAILLVVYAIQIWLSYRYVSAHIAERANSAMALHMSEVWRYHNAQFGNSQGIANLIATQFENERRDSTHEMETSARFQTLFETKNNGETTLRAPYKDFKKFPSAGAPKGSDFTTATRKNLVAGFDLLSNLGPILFDTSDSGNKYLYSAFVWYPNAGITVFSPRGAWGIVDASWETIAGYPSVKGAMPENNKERAPFWSPVYFDQDVKTWMTTYSVPSAIDGKWVATAGVDVSLDQLVALTSNPTLPGSYNVIMRDDGEVVAHPRLRDYLETGKKHVLDDPMLPILRKEVSHSAKPVVVDKPDLDFLYSKASLPGPRLTMFMILPRSVIRAEAWKLGRVSLITGALALLAALAGIYYALSRRVLLPIKTLHAATRKIMSGDHNVVLQPLKSDELGEVTLAFSAMVSQLNERQIALKRQATVDVLTELPNRSELFEQLSTRIAAATQNQGRFALLFIDLDRFKTINDSLGHHQGDMLLREAARRMRRVLPDSVALGRHGGDEFLMLVDPISDTAACVKVVSDALNQPFELGNRRVQVTCSIGISHFPDHGSNAIELIRHADTAMYHAKTSGRNRYAVYSRRMGEVAERNFLLESRFRDAVTNRQFRFAYQRVVDHEHHRTCGAEALLRWHDPELGYVPPDQVIALAEELGYSTDIARFTVDSAFEFLALHHDKLPASFKLAINFSPEQFSASAVIDHLIARAVGLAKNGPSVEVEITESTLLIDSRIAQDHIARLAEAGIDVGIDDFGTGYASLSYLQRYAIKFMKIDRSFTQMVQHRDDNLPIVEVMTDLAHKLGLRITVEGVETVEQVAYFSKRGAMLLQGFYFGMPGSPEALMAHQEAPLNA